MRKTYLLIALTTLAVAISSCKDDALRKRVDELELKVRTLENVPEPTLALAFNYSEDSYLKKGETVHIGYTVTSNIRPVQVEAVPGNGLSAEITTNGTTGDIAVTFGTLLDFTSTSLVVIANNGKKVEMTKFTFTEGGIEASDNLLKEVPKEGGPVTLEFLTNEAYDLIIPEHAQSWLQKVSTKVMNENVIDLYASENQSVNRTARVVLKGKSTGTEIVYTITQANGFDYGILMETTARTVTVPTIVTRKDGGIISWGDGTEEAYTQGATHTYDDGVDVHYVAVGYNILAGFSIDSMEGVTMIDLSSLNQ